MFVKKRVKKENFQVCEETNTRYNKISMPPLGNGVKCYINLFAVNQMLISCHIK